nr:MAG TPA: hypothetical protein [Ackermannviridae sp.]
MNISEGIITLIEIMNFGGCVLASTCRTPYYIHTLYILPYIYLYHTLPYCPIFLYFVHFSLILYYFLSFCPISEHFSIIS